MSVFVSVSVSKPFSRMFFFGFLILYPFERRLAEGPYLSRCQRFLVLFFFLDDHHPQPRDFQSTSHCWEYA